MVEIWLLCKLIAFFQNKLTNNIFINILNSKAEFD